MKCQTTPPPAARGHAAGFAALCVVVVCLVAAAEAHPAPSLKLCHGPQQDTVYHYKYSTLQLLNNNDRQGREPVGFGYTSHFSVQNVWEDETDFVLKVSPLLLAALQLANCERVCAGDVNRAGVWRPLHDARRRGTARAGADYLQKGNRVVSGAIAAVGFRLANYS